MIHDNITSLRQVPEALVYYYLLIYEAQFHCIIILYNNKGG